MVKRTTSFAVEITKGLVRPACQSTDAAKDHKNDDGENNGTMHGHANPLASPNPKWLLNLAIVITKSRASVHSSSAKKRSLQAAWVLYRVRARSMKAANGRKRHFK